MKKITWEGSKEKLTGNLIEGGKDMSFDLLDAKGKKVEFMPDKGIVVVSTFPALNTTICDSQSIVIAKAAAVLKNIFFVSITTDSPSVIDRWCVVRKYGNAKIYSDYKRDFGKQTNTLIKKRDKLARGFMVFIDGELKEVSYNEEVQSEPNYSILDKYYDK